MRGIGGKRENAPCIWWQRGEHTSGGRRGRTGGKGENTPDRGRGLVAKGRTRQTAGGKGKNTPAGGGGREGQRKEER